MNRLKALWKLLTCTQYLLVTHRSDKRGNLRDTSYGHNMTAEEERCTIGVMFCHIKTEETLREASELLARGLTKK